MAVAYSPAVRLQISIKDTKIPEEERVLKRLTNGYEEVDVDGFIFRRKIRRVDDASKSHQPLTHSPCGDTAERSEHWNVGQKAASPVVLADEATHDAERQTEDLPVDEAENRILQDASENVSRQGQADLDQVENTIAQQEQAEIEDLEDNGNSQEELIKSHEQIINQAIKFKSAESIAGSLLASLPEGLTNAAKLSALCQHVMQGSQNGLLQEFLGSEDKNQSKALLQAVLQNLSDGIGEALGNGTLLCCDPLQIKPKAIDAQSLQLAVKRKALQQQLDRYTQEEKDWGIILQDSNRPLLLATQEAIQPSSEDAQNTVENNLQQYQHEAHGHLTLQVDNLSAMMGRAEELLGKAEGLCKVMQAEYHREKFMKYPHINSPAKLIHEIVRPRHSRFMPSSAF